jgi:hypothetical protein
MSVYRSSDPLDFDDAELVAHMTGIWYNGRWAPEVVRADGQWYIAGYGRGIHVARFDWVAKTPEQVVQWRADWLRYLAEEHRKRRQREASRRSEKGTTD